MYNGLTTKEATQVCNYILTYVHLYLFLSRPKATLECNHPLFWDPKTHISFFHDTSDIIESKYHDQTLKNLLRKSIRYNSWFDFIDENLHGDIRHQGIVDHNLRGLLRVIRNKYSHYIELSEDLENFSGEDPNELDAYFRDKFPGLLMYVYKVMQKYPYTGRFLRWYSKEYHFVSFKVFEC